MNYEKKYKKYKKKYLNKINNLNNLNNLNGGSDMLKNFLTAYTDNSIGISIIIILVSKIYSFLQYKSSQNSQITSD